MVQGSPTPVSWHARIVPFRGTRGSSHFVAREDRPISRHARIVPFRGTRGSSHQVEIADLRLPGYQPTLLHTGLAPVRHERLVRRGWGEPGGRRLPDTTARPQWL
jgi:hypothetical protein